MDKSNDVATTEVDNVDKETSKASKVVKSVDTTPSFTNNTITSINLFDERQMLAAESFFKRMMRTEKGGIKSIEDGFAILMRAKDLNLPFSTCIEHIHVINGKTGVDIHVIKALLSRAGCVWECTKDYQPLYEYTDGINVYVDGSLPPYVHRVKSRKEADDKNSPDSDEFYVYPVKWYKDLKGNLYKEYQLNSSFEVAVTKAQIADVIKRGKTPVYRIPNQPIDFITEYKLERVVRGKEVTAFGHFTFSEAKTAGLFDKDTYTKYARILISHRAFTYAARDICSDILFGILETTELKIVNNVSLDETDVIDVDEVN